MEKMIKIWAINKAKELIRINIYQSEIWNKGKSGIEKMDFVIKDFWDRLEKYAIKEKNIDRKLIPDAIEDIAEDVLIAAIRELKNKISIKEIAQKLFDIEKAETLSIF